MRRFTYLFGLALMALMLMPQTVSADKSRVTLSFVGADGSAVRQIEATVGEDVTEPRLTCDVPEVLRSITYSTSSDRIAAVDPYSGEVTAVSAGTASITAYFVGNDNYYESRAVYNVVVKEKTTPVVPTCPDAKFYYNGAELTTLTLKVGDVASIPMLLGSAGQIFSMSAKTIEGIRVAELTEDDMIHAVGEGTALFVGGVSYKTTDTTLFCEYSFMIVVQAAAPEKADPQLSFSATEVNVELGEAFVAPTLQNPNAIQFTPANSKWYTQWDSKVAQVNEQTGEVTILGVGDETISFEFTGNDTYKAAIASYMIHVTTSGLTVGGVTVTNKNCNDVLGDNGSITYDPINHILTMTNAALSGSNMTLMPGLKAATADALPDAAILYTDKAPLTIVLNGGNAISQADAGIYTVSAPVVMMGGENGGSIRISATTVGIKAQPFKIFRCTVSAYGGAAGIATTELGVALGGQLLAQGPSLAIQATSFVKAEDNNGEGIDILTAGVHFAEKPNPGFYTDEKNTKPATFVEIGKVAVVVPDDEQTTIDFTQTDPDGNESVVFSADANNTYNETTGQLEITTSLTDEQVATALENLIPGSSQWVEALPGSLVFDIPAGEGEIEVKCMTVPGYSLQVKVEGKAAISLTQVSLGWAKVQYNVTEPVHVVIYLHANSGSAPARIAANNYDETPTVGAYIQAVQITPKNAPTAIDLIESNQGKNGKILRNGNLYIIRDGHVFNATGAELK